MATNAGESISKFEFLKQLAEGSVVVGAALFLMGWSYLFGYYRYFGLSLAEFVFTTQTVLMYAMAVLLTPVFISAAIALLVAYTACTRISRLSRFTTHPAASVLLVLLVAIAASWYATLLGRLHAQADTYASSTTLPYVKLESNGKTLAESGCSTDNWDYLLLLRSGGQIYVFVPIQEPTQAVSNLRVCSFPETTIAGVRLQVNVGGSE